MTPIRVLIFTFPLFLSQSLLLADESCHDKKSSGLESLIGVAKFAIFGTDATSRLEKMGDYKVKGACPKKVTSSVKSIYYRCTDGSITYKQPKSTGVRGYNGFCGETALSNVLHMQCQITSDPERYSNLYTDDLTPGTRPESLTQGLNKVFDRFKGKCPKGKWQVYSGAKSGEEYINSLVSGLNRKKSHFTRTRNDGTKINRSPTPILIENPPKGSKGLHWVSLVDITGFKKNKPLNSQPNCRAIINHWGGQYRVPCERLAAWAKETGDGAAGVITGSYPRVKFFHEK